MAFRPASTAPKARLLTELIRTPARDKAAGSSAEIQQKALRHHGGQGAPHPPRAIANMPTRRSHVENAFRFRILLRRPARS